MHRIAAQATDRIIDSLFTPLANTLFAGGKDESDWFFRHTKFGITRTLKST
jgi:hypothetical protein